MDQTVDVKVLKRCRVAPPPGSVPSTSLPLTFFDIPWLLCPPTQRIFFFQFPHPTHHFLHTLLPSLQNSLSLALHHFFPYSANLLCPPPPLNPYILYVDGDSLPFVVAESTANFHHLIADYPRDARDLHAFLPDLPSPRVLEDGTRVISLMAIQVTVVSHFGFSIGIVHRHVTADGRSFNQFVKSWASICRTQERLEDLKPSYNNRDEIKQYSNATELEMNFLQEWWNWVSESKQHTVDPVQIPAEKVRTTIVLTPTQIQKLKHWASEELDQDAPHLSTFVVTCALIWVSWVKSEDDDDDDKVCYFVFVADCRNRYEFCIPSTYFGNCLALCFVRLKRKEVVGMGGLVEAMKAIGNKIKELERGALRGGERWMVNWKETTGNHLVTVAGSPKFDGYQIDFGWGRPTKIELVNVDNSEVMSICESREEEGGIEVGLALSKLQMDNFNSILQRSLESL